MIVNEIKLNGCNQKIIDLVKKELGPMANEMNTDLIITSGKRSKEHNAEIGGSLTSYHLKGDAIDFYFKDVNVFKLVTNFYYLVAKQEGSFKEIIEFEVCRNKVGVQHFHIAFGIGIPRYFTGIYR